MSGAGPYKITKWDKGVSITLRKKERPLVGKLPRKLVLPSKC
jgi:hypothetical protein